MKPSPLPRTDAPPQAAAWVNVAAKVGGAGISFLFYIVLARTMTPEAFADVAVVMAWLALASSLACLSAPLVLIRFVPDNLALGRFDLARGVMQSTFTLTAAIAAAIGAVTAAVIFTGVLALPRNLPKSALIAAALLVPSVLLVDMAGLLTGLKRAAIAELLVNVSRPALMVASLAVLWFLGKTPMPAPAVLAVYLGASVVMVAVCVAYALSVLPREVIHARPAYAPREWMHSAGGFMVVIIASAVLERIDILMMGMLAPSAHVATYAVAVRFAQTVVVAASAAGAVMAPHLVERLADLREGRRGELQELVRNTARTSLYVSLLALTGFATLGPLFLKLFGHHYEQSYVPLVILASGQALAALLGPAAPVATLTGHPRIALAAVSIGIAVNASLNFLLVPRWGANGAAIATATGMICTSSAAWFWTRRRLLLDTSVFRGRAR